MIKDFKISKFYSFYEVTDSKQHPDLVAENREVAVPFIPIIQNQLMRTVDPLCEVYGKFYIISGFRCQKLNKKVGGHILSRHTSGLAVDLRQSWWARHKVLQNNIPEIAKKLIKLGAPFHKFIYERGKYTDWIHLSSGSDLKRFLFYQNGIYAKKEIKIF